MCGHTPPPLLTCSVEHGVYSPAKRSLGAGRGCSFEQSHRRSEHHPVPAAPAGPLSELTCHMERSSSAHAGLRHSFTHNLFPRLQGGSAGRSRDGRAGRAWGWAGARGARGAGQLPHPPSVSTPRPRRGVLEEVVAARKPEGSWDSVPPAGARARRPAHCAPAGGALAVPGAGLRAAPSASPARRRGVGRRLQGGAPKHTDTRFPPRPAPLNPSRGSWQPRGSGAFAQMGDQPRARGCFSASRRPRGRPPRPGVPCSRSPCECCRGPHGPCGLRAPPAQEVVTKGRSLQGTGLRPGPSHRASHPISPTGLTFP